MKNILGLYLGVITLTTFVIIGEVTVSAKAQEIEQIDVFVNGEDGVHQYRIPVLVTTNKGTLLAFCDARVNRRGDAPNNIDLVMKRSLDGGRTWGKLKVLVNVGEGAAADSCAVVDRDTGTVWVFFGYYPVGVGSRNAKRGLYGATVMNWLIKSDDDGETWSKPIDVTAMVKKPQWRAGSPGPGVGIQTRSGRLIVPRYYLTGLDHHVPYVTYSDDHGNTWKIGGEVQGGEGKVNEAQLVEFADGSLLINMRGHGAVRRVARSIDGGMSWLEITKDPYLYEPGCQASMAQYTDRLVYAKDRLLFSNPNDYRERKNMTVRMSYDEGRSWPVEKQLYAGPSAYSCLTVLPDMRIACLYERGKETPYEKITLARFALGWLTEGKDSLSPN